MEQGSDLTGATWTTNAQYLRAGGGCSSMLIRRKSSTDDEYHHEDLLGNFGVITGATGAVLSRNVYDAFMEVQYLGNPVTSPCVTISLRKMTTSLLTGSQSALYANRNLRTTATGTSTDVLPWNPILATICGLACLGAIAIIIDSWTKCQNNCKGRTGISWGRCFGNCLLSECKSNTLEKWICGGCIACIINLIPVPVPITSPIPLPGSCTNGPISTVINHAACFN